jgi:hypothetical protein
MIKKLSFSFLVLSFGISMSFAKTVPVNNAELVASNFIKQNTGDNSPVLKLMYTAKTSNGSASFYVFDLNNAHGFVIVSAEDSGKPIIGYSASESFSIPAPGSNIAYWLDRRTKEIEHLQFNHIEATSDITQLWDSYTKGIPVNNQKRSASTNTVAPLLTTLWNQSPYYNDLCPGGSVTGCVATAMAQIIKYWAYPLHGTGQSSYNENDYGPLSANYAMATYIYSLMPNSLSGPNSEVAQLMSDCGISVNMDYSPSGSSAFVICSDNPISAQHSYTAYFGYDPNQIQGLYRDNFADANWHSKLKGDLDIGRPIQYAGFGNDGGHTWVVDGYDVNDMYHMNWGWGGSANGYFDINTLNPAGMDFSNSEEAVFGIVPNATQSVDAGVLNITPNNIVCNAGTINPVVTIRNYGINNLTSCLINYKIDNQNYQQMTWNGSLVTGQTATVALTGNNFSAGSHTFICNTSNPNNGADPDLSNDQSIASVGLIAVDQLPLVEGFETQTAYDHFGVIPSQGSDWAIVSGVGSGGNKCYKIDNLNNTPGNISILQGLNDYDLSWCGAVQMSFKVAYKQKTATSADKLQLQVSNNCGKTWNTRWSKQGAQLATTQFISLTPYNPLPSEFVQYTATVPFYQSAIFRFVFTSDESDPGNNIFLDDVNLVDPTVGLKENTLSAGLNLYPNPAKEKITIECNTLESHNINIEVIDVLGKKITSIDKGKVDAGSHEFELFTSAYKSGVYFVNISVDGNRIVKRLVIQN